MTILRQQDQGLVVYSPVALNDDLKRQIMSLGTVKRYYRSQPFSSPLCWWIRQGLFNGSSLWSG